MVSLAPSMRTRSLSLMPALFVVLWSTGFIGGKFGLPYAGPMTFLTLRFWHVGDAHAGRPRSSSAPPGHASRARSAMSRWSGCSSSSTYLGGASSPCARRLGRHRGAHHRPPAGADRGARRPPRRRAAAAAAVAGAGARPGRPDAGLWEKLDFASAPPPPGSPRPAAPSSASRSDALPEALLRGRDLAASTVIQNATAGWRCASAPSPSRTMHIDVERPTSSSRSSGSCLVLSVGATMLLLFLLRRGAAARSPASSTSCRR